MTLHNFLKLNYLHSNTHTYTSYGIDTDISINEINIRDCNVIAKVSNRPLELVLNLIIKHL